MGVFRQALGLAPAIGSLPIREEAAPAIRRTVQLFAEAWYWGDSQAMLGCLHPDYVNRLITLGTASRPLGVQGELGAQTPPDRRTVDVRILEARRASASAVAELCGWVIHLHLARSSGQWKIVNAMWASKN
jgi:hypothetical protein